MVLIQGPEFGLGVTKRLGLTLQPHGGYGQSEEIRLILWGACGGLVVLALLLLATRVRFLGIVWRAGGVVVAAVPTFYVYAAWAFVSDPMGAIGNEDTGTLARLARAGADATRTLGLWDVTPGPGLYLLTAGILVFLIALLIPSGKRTCPAHPTTSQRLGTPD